MGVAERLAALRQRAGLSQGEVAERLNVSRQAVSRWETGLTIPSIDNLARLSKLYGITLDELLGHSPVLPPEPPREKSTEEALAEQPTEAAQQPTEEAAAPPPAANSAPTHTRAVIIALSILCLLLAISTALLLYHQKEDDSNDAISLNDTEIEILDDVEFKEVELEW